MQTYSVLLYLIIYLFPAAVHLGSNFETYHILINDQNSSHLQVWKENNLDTENWLVPIDDPSITLANEVGHEVGQTDEAVIVFAYKIGL